ncbi:hypothetical protein KVR01_012039 [Diaporthe batatas]|uniref:uncharacterized protein n=1 Tax=Diaporthe batatas TaxID=748121 RepID=UPI001D0379BB|nr:uncharacterized protein KVR01_012039 [Diaporthe batatas]KAG8158278.1 hypothetical protein KVR01_012039 [Diaporthe batatas]
MKLATSTITLLLSILLTVSAAPIQRDVSALEGASPEGVVPVVGARDASIEADSEASMASETDGSFGDALSADEVSQYEERGNHCDRSLPVEARGGHHNKCPPPAAPAPVIIVPAPAAPAPVGVPVPVPEPVGVPVPVPVPAPVGVPVPGVPVTVVPAPYQYGGHKKADNSTEEPAPTEGKRLV